MSKGVLARKDKRGRWRFEVVERREWEVPEVAENMPRVGVDVGLTSWPPTSDGMLLGANLKPKFNALYGKVKAVRANRQRQGFKENSPRLDRLESKITGMVKTMAGECSNKLVAAYPDHVFVIEDLDLRAAVEPSGSPTERFITTWSRRLRALRSTRRIPVRHVHRADTSLVSTERDDIHLPLVRQDFTRGRGRRDQLARTFRGQTGWARRSPIRREGFAERAISGAMPNEFLGRVRTERACTVRPEAYYRST